jgi:hypothetical protein
MNMMQLKWISILALGLLLLPAELFAQISLERQVVASGGSYSTGTNISLSATVGEAAAVTLTSGTIVLTQGFQQPDMNPSTGIDDQVSILVDYMVFPNPTAGSLTLRLESETPVSFQLEVVDAAGRIVWFPSEPIRVSGRTDTEVDLSGFATGTYLFVLRDTQSGYVETLRVLKE